MIQIIRERFGSGLWSLILDNWSIRNWNYKMNESFANDFYLEWFKSFANDLNRAFGPE